MAYLNTKENEKRYQAIKAEYQAHASKRDVMRQVKRASLEVAKSMLQDIDNEISEWREQHWWGIRNVNQGIFYTAQNPADANTPA